MGMVADMAEEAWCEGQEALALDDVYVPDSPADDPACDLCMFDPGICPKCNGTTVTHLPGPDAVSELVAAAATARARLRLIVAGLDGDLARAVDWVVADLDAALRGVR